MVSINGILEAGSNPILNVFKYNGILVKNIPLNSYLSKEGEVFQINYLLKTSELDQGIYLIKVNYGTHQKVLKLIVQ